MGRDANGPVLRAISERSVDEIEDPGFHDRANVRSLEILLVEEDSTVVGRKADLQASLPAPEHRPLLGAHHLADPVFRADHQIPTPETHV
jgi:hypothetical protein